MRWRTVPSGSSYQRSRSHCPGSSRSGSVKRTLLDFGSLSSCIGWRDYRTRVSGNWQQRVHHVRVNQQQDASKHLLNVHQANMLEPTQSLPAGQLTIWPKPDASLISWCQLTKTIFYSQDEFLNLSSIEMSTILSCPYVDVHRFKRCSMQRHSSKFLYSGWKQTLSFLLPSDMSFSCLY